MWRIPHHRLSGSPRLAAAAAAASTSAAAALPRAVAGCFCSTQLGSASVASSSRPLAKESEKLPDFVDSNGSGGKIRSSTGGGSQRIRRNAKLAAVIRDGHNALQSGSSRLQDADLSTTRSPTPPRQLRTPSSPVAAASSAPHHPSEEGGIGPESAGSGPGATAMASSSPVARPEWEENVDETRQQLSVEQIAEGHRLMEAAADALEAMCRKSSPAGGYGTGGLVLAGEPIVLLDVHVHKNLRSAVIYWTLPLPILWDDKTNDDVKMHMVQWFDLQLNTDGTPQRMALQELTRRVAATLRAYRVPRIIWKPAPPDMMMAFQSYQDDFGGN